MNRISPRGNSMEKKYLNFSNKKSLQLECEEHLAKSAVSLTEKQKLSLYKKSQKSGIDTGVLEEVYRRGYLIWKPDLFEGTREQFAFDRVNSFISGGFAADIDKDIDIKTHVETLGRKLDQIH